MAAGSSVAGRDLLGDRACRSDDLGAATVVERDDERQAVVAGGACDARARTPRASAVGQLVHPADDPHAHVHPLEVVDLALEHLDEQRMSPVTSSSGRLQFSEENE